MGVAATLPELPGDSWESPKVRLHQIVGACCYQIFPRSCCDGRHALLVLLVGVGVRI